VKRAVSIDERARQQCDLVRKQQRELEAAEVRWKARLAALAEEKRAELQELKAQHVRELVDLWVAQGRKLGPWAAPVLEGKLPNGFPSEKGGSL
jgi:hypothetical protein